MRKEKELLCRRGYCFVSASAVALFIISGRMLYVSGEYVKGEWRGVLGSTALAAVIAILALSAVTMASESVFTGDGGGRLIKIIFSAVAAVAAVYVAVISIEELFLFSSEVMQLSASRLTVSAVVLLLGIYMSRAGCRSIKKYGAVVLVFNIASALGLLLLSGIRGGMQTENLGVLFTDEAFSDSLSPDSIFGAFFSIFAPASIAVIWLSLCKKRTGCERRSVFCTVGGILCGAFVLLVCFLNTALLLGLPFASEQVYPYVSAIGAISAGKLFMRPEGLIYISYISAVTVRLAVCISLICLLLRGARLSVRGKSGGRLIHLCVGTVIIAVYSVIFYL